MICTLGYLPTRAGGEDRRGVRAACEVPRGSIPPTSQCRKCQRQAWTFIMERCRSHSRTPAARGPATARAFGLAAFRAPSRLARAPPGFAAGALEPRPEGCERHSLRKASSPPLIPRKYMARQRTQTASAVAARPFQARAHRQPDRAACGATGASLRQSIAWLPGSGLRHFLPHHRPCALGGAAVGVTLLRPVRLLVLPCAGLCRQARAALF